MYFRNYFEISKSKLNTNKYNSPSLFKAEMEMIEPLLSSNVNGSNISLRIFLVK